MTRGGCLQTIMGSPDIDVKLGNSCATRKERCINCNSRFVNVRPLVKSVAISNHFLKDLGEGEVKSIVNDVLDCSNVYFQELHKFEENVDGNLLFRAKKQGVHIVYGVDKKMRIVFLRAFRNYSEYAKFLENKNEIKKIIYHAFLI